MRLSALLTPLFLNLASWAFDFFHLQASKFSPWAVRFYDLSCHLSIALLLWSRMLCALRFQTVSGPSYCTCLWESHRSAQSSALFARAPLRTDWKCCGNWRSATGDPFGSSRVTPQSRTVLVAARSGRYGFTRQIWTSYLHSSLWTCPSRPVTRPGFGLISR